MPKENARRVFTLWLNSLGVKPDVFNLFENPKDGLIILQAFDKIYPGSVVWRRVSEPKEVQVKRHGRLEERKMRTWISVSNRIKVHFHDSRR